MNQNFMVTFIFQFSPSPSFGVFFLFLLARIASASVDPLYEACLREISCGDGQIIRYPFYIQGKQEPFCGYPGFEVSCNSKGKPVLKLHGNDYIIDEIFYSNLSLRLSSAAFSERNFCEAAPLTRNLSLPEDRFMLISNKTEVSLLYNCNSSLNPNLLRYKVEGCSNETNIVLALYKDDHNLSDAVKECKNRAVVPVYLYGDDSGDAGIEEAVSRGFVLTWIASNCSVCETSGGKCGFNASTYHFQCFCTDRPHAARCSPSGNGKGRLRLVLGLVGVSTLLVVVVSIGIIWHCKKQRYTSPSFNERYTSSEPSSKSELEVGSAYFGVPIFSYRELSEATNNFSHEKELGDGGFGTVYYAKLRDGREVAVKRLYEHNYKRVEQFMNEVEILTRLRHRNLVHLYGCTSRHSQQGLLLVYEYIPNGTLADHLHGDRAKPGSLTWPTRMNIAIETASALAYLHACEIIHRDVKTNNILLDNNFCVKVADFGLSRLIPTNVTHVSTAPQGSPGYVDPEYHQYYQLTDKSDVYSFGVVLIELISSMPAVDISRHRNEINLANLAVNRIQERAIDELIDPCLGYHSDEEVKRMATSVAELAFLCLQHNKEMRPSMEVVLEELKRIESGESLKWENLNEKHDDSEALESMRPPASPPDWDERALLKPFRVPSSPISVTAKWVSNNTTPDVSC